MGFKLPDGPATCLKGYLMKLIHNVEVEQDGGGSSPLITRPANSAGSDNQIGTLLSLRNVRVERSIVWQTPMMESR